MFEQHHYVTPIVPLTFMYNYRVGAYMERYLRGLAQKKILGVRCRMCKRVLVPPRSTCGPCHTGLDEWVEVGPTGVLENFTVAHVYIEKGQIKDLPIPAIIGMIRLDGADSLVTGKVQGVAPDHCYRGLRVRAVWREVPKGEIRDLDHYEPAT